MFYIVFVWGIWVCGVVGKGKVGSVSMSDVVVVRVEVLRWR